ncbi:peptide N-acetyl-beta-D-glucosaminyl asparaginase amidase A-domain-containing protein [Schizophyllum commune]
MLLGAVALATLGALPSLAQLTPEELQPLLDGLANRPLPDITSSLALNKRVPLMTDDHTISPLVDLQLFAPPVVPTDGTSCSQILLQHTFGDGSYGNPTVAAYAPPTDEACGEVGKWATISLNLTVYSYGTQYDRLGSIYLSHAEIWRTSSAEPTKTGTVWTTLKDVTHYTALFAQEGMLLMDFGNIVDESLLLDGAFDGEWRAYPPLTIADLSSVTLTATFYAPTVSFPTPETADMIVPLSLGVSDAANYFTLDSDAGGPTAVLIPPNTTEAFAEVFCSGNSAEEFWYLNTPDEYIDYFPESTGLIAKGPFREVQVLVDGTLAAIVWPYPVIYTGGVTPSLWRPLTSYGAYDAPTYWVDLTPVLPLLLNNSTAAANGTHNITLAVVGQGEEGSTINSNWFVSGGLHLRLGVGQTSGKITKYEALARAEITTTGDASEGNVTVWTKVEAKRSLLIEAELATPGGNKTVRFEQSASYSNSQLYADQGWLQWANQSTIGTTTSTHGGIQRLRDAFEYPLAVFSNYSLYEMQYGAYGSSINQTHTRVLSAPFTPTKRLQSIQRAVGEIGMDDWPGLRHAINGTGATEQTFAYQGARGQTYFRDAATKNDGWVRDAVWGTLADANPAVPREQIYGPEGGPGFRRELKEL